MAARGVGRERGGVVEPKETVLCSASHEAHLGTSHEPTWRSHLGEEAYEATRPGRPSQNQTLTSSAEGPALGQGPAASQARSGTGRPAAKQAGSDARQRSRLVASTWGLR